MNVFQFQFAKSHDSFYTHCNYQLITFHIFQMLMLSQLNENCEIIVHSLILKCIQLHSIDAAETAGIRAGNNNGCQKRTCKTTQF